ALDGLPAGPARRRWVTGYRAPPGREPRPHRLSRPRGSRKRRPADVCVGQLAPLRRMMMNTKRKSKNTPKKSDPPPALPSGTGELVIDLFLTDAILCLGGAAGFAALAAWVALAVGGDACLAAFERRARRVGPAAADLDEDARREQGARFL